MAKSLSDFESRSYGRIVENGERALARWSANNPMRSLVEAQVADARAKLGCSTPVTPA